MDDLLKQQLEEARLELFSIRDFLRWTVSRFNEADLYYGHGTDEPWDDAVALLLHSLKLPQDIDQRILDARLTLSEKHAFLELVMQRLEKRLPVPYITHEAYFLEMPFYVDERVLIPRSPIGELIEEKFSPWIEEENVKSILDIGTGSGCIAIACSYYFPDSQVTAVDISSDALAVAEKNCEQYRCEDDVKLVQSDLFSALPKERFDIIVSNPPYVSEDEMLSLPEEYHHEPSLALKANDEGLDIVIRILQKAPDYLADHGILVVEVGNSQQALEARFPTVPFVWLDFKRGGQGVFLLTAAELTKHKDIFKSKGLT